MKCIYSVERGLAIDSSDCLLIGRGRSGQWIVGIPVKTKNAANWARQGARHADWKWLEAAAQTTKETLCP